MTNEQQRLILPDDPGYACADPPDDAADRLSRLADVGLPDTARVGFVVLLTDTGQWIAHSDVKTAAEVTFERECTLLDMINGSALVHDDANSQRIAAMATEQTVTHLMQQLNAQAQAAAAEMEKRKIMQTLHQPPRR